MKTQIAIQYPIVEDIVIKTEAEAKALGYKSAIVRHMPVNRLQHITVHVPQATEDLIAKCVAQTGMTPSEYQSKHGRAWNE